MPVTLVEEAETSYFKKHVRERPLNAYGTPVKPGRPKNSDPRSVGAQVRHAIMNVFSQLGDWEGMMAWAKDNPDLFYGQVVPKLLPKPDSEAFRGNFTVVVNRSPSDKPLDESVINVTPLATMRNVTEGTD